MKEQKVEEPYKCPWCGKRFRERAKAEKHEQECPKRPVKYAPDK